MRIIYIGLITLFFILNSACQKGGSPAQSDGGDGEIIIGDEKVCQFKTNHVSVAFSGPQITLTSTEEQSLPDVIKTGGFLGMGKDFSKVRSTAVENGVAVDYKYNYDKVEEEEGETATEERDGYSDWCPEDGNCIVKVVYVGAYQKERSHPRAPVTSGRYVYNGDITVQIHFAGRALDFSACP